MSLRAKALISVPKLRYQEIVLLVCRRTAHNPVAPALQTETRDGERSLQRANEVGEAVGLMTEAGKPWRLRRGSNNNKTIQRPRGGTRGQVSKQAGWQVSLAVPWLGGERGWRGWDTWGGLFHAHHADGSLTHGMLWRLG